MNNNLVPQPTLSAMREERYSPQSVEPWRSAAERDADRILYASSFRRLAGVTQVVPAIDRPIVHNRLTHSLKVAQVARGVAQELVYRTDGGAIEVAGGLDPNAAEAAGLAHDLGHPPFGHVAEKELQALLGGQGSASLPELPDSFEGNAQTFRIVTKLSIRKRQQSDGNAGRPDLKGLNLSRATLAGVLKYPWCCGEHLKRNAATAAANDYYGRKWCAYESERDNLNWALEAIPAGRMRSLEAEIMDFADDVTYAVHDIEDFFRVGLIPLPTIRAYFIAGQSEVGEDFWDYAVQEIAAKGEVDFNPNVARKALKEMASVLPERSYEGWDRDRLDLHYFISRTVGVLQSGLSISPQGALVIPAESTMVIEVLKQLNWYFVIGHPALSAAQEGQRTVIRNLVEWVYKWASDMVPEIGAKVLERRKKKRQFDRELPIRLQSCLAIAEKERGTSAYSEEQARLRGVVDYITGLTEVEAYELHRRLGGIDSTSILAGVIWR